MMEDWCCQCHEIPEIRGELGQVTQWYITPPLYLPTSLPTYLHTTYLPTDLPTTDLPAYLLT